MRRLFTTLALVLFFALIGLFAYRSYSRRDIRIAEQSVHRGTILITGVQEPEEMRVEPIPVEVLRPPERMLGEAMQQAEQAGKSDPAALRPALNRILAKYPDYSDGYVMRLGSLCEGNDRAAILSNVNSAIKYVGNARTGKDSLTGLLSIRAKIEHANADDAAAMEDLDRAIQANLADSTQFVNSGAVAPEKTASSCTWTETEMDALVQRFPNDYRAYLFRGLYYGFFAQWNEDSLKPASENLHKAAEMNSNSALPHFFIASILNRAFSIKRYGMTDAQRAELNQTVLDELNRALVILPNLLPALKDRAEVYFQLKQYRQAVPDYDKVLALDPKDAGAYNDRGLAKTELGDTYEAISDFGKAIENKKRELQHSRSEENRADAYMKTGQCDAAIRDLTTAISLQIGGVVILSNIQQFRALYPEYKTASDEAVARKLNQTFYPNMKYEDFSKGFLQNNKAFSSTVIPDLYLKRSDAYLKKDDWHGAAVEFRRAVNGFPDYANAVDRWREIGSQKVGSNARHFSIDLKTFDDAERTSVRLWVKQTKSSESRGPYSVQRFELNCSSRQMRMLSVASYDALGNLIFTREGGPQWESIVPDTMGEQLASGACQNN